MAADAQLAALRRPAASPRRRRRPSPRCPAAGSRCRSARPPKSSRRRSSSARSPGQAAGEVRVLGQAPALEQRDARSAPRRRGPGSAVSGADETRTARSVGTFSARTPICSSGGSSVGTTLVTVTDSARMTSRPGERIEPLGEDQVPAGRQRGHQAEAERVRVVERQHRELRLAVEPKVDAPCSRRWRAGSAARARRPFGLPVVPEV